MRSSLPISQMCPAAVSTGCGDEGSLNLCPQKGLIRWQDALRVLRVPEARGAACLPTKLLLARRQGSPRPLSATVSVSALELLPYILASFLGASSMLRINARFFKF